MPMHLYPSIKSIEKRSAQNRPETTRPTKGGINNQNAEKEKKHIAWQKTAWQKTTSSHSSETQGQAPRLTVPLLSGLLEPPISIFAISLLNAEAPYPCCS